MVVDGDEQKGGNERGSGAAGDDDYKLSNLLV
jgi:hypothetical protein